MVPVVVLAIVAIAIIKSLMTVVARDASTTVAPWSPDPASMPMPEPSSYDLTVNDPTVRLRATVNDDARGFLLPAVPEPADVEPAEAEPTGVTEQTRSPR